MRKNIAVISGDGVGPEITRSAKQVLNAIGEKYGHDFEYEEALAGGRAIDEKGKPLPEESIKILKDSDSVLLAAVGGPKWDTLPGDMRPERALLGARYELELFSNLRPAKLFDELKDACPLKDPGMFDMLIVRELTGGIYFGERGRKDDYAFDTEKYSISEIDRICEVAFQTAMKRRKKLTSVDKANVLESSRLWRERVIKMAEKYPEVELNHLLVDNAAMQLVKDPAQFDVMVTSNMFGDILSDEASMITGSIGMLPSASLGVSTRGLFEPIHGSAPDIAGKGIVNPIATILSVAMMLRLAFDMPKEADNIEDAVEITLKQGVRTKDIAGGDLWVSTDEMTAAIVKNLGL